jgi:hypothetical protein
MKWVYFRNVVQLSNNYCSQLVLKGNKTITCPIVQVLMRFSSDITIELATPDDCFLVDVPLLILENRRADKIMGKVNMLSRESNPGVWNADQVMIL